MIFRSGMQSVGPVGAMGVVRDGATGPETAIDSGNDNNLPENFIDLDQVCLTSLNIMRNFTLFK